jgi:hypothetical protein
MGDLLVLCADGAIDGSDAVSDWPLFNALLNCASGATWASIYHGGGMGIGYSPHAGTVIVCDGTPEAARRIARVLWNDPATGVMRHADAGYEDAVRVRRRTGLSCPASLEAGSRHLTGDCTNGDCLPPARQVSAERKEGAGRLADGPCICMAPRLSGPDAPSSRWKLLDRSRSP